MQKSGVEFAASMRFTDALFGQLEPCLPQLQLGEHVDTT
jgi:hypothetical protein